MTFVDIVDADGTTLQSADGVDLWWADQIDVGAITETEVLVSLVSDLDAALIRIGENYDVKLIVLEPERQLATIVEQHTLSTLRIEHELPLSTVSESNVVSALQTELQHELNLSTIFSHDEVLSLSLQAGGEAEVFLTRILESNVLELLDLDFNITLVPIIEASHAFTIFAIGSAGAIDLDLSELALEVLEVYNAQVLVEAGMVLKIPEESEELLNVAVGLEDQDPTTLPVSIGLSSIAGEQPAIMVPAIWRPGGPWILKVAGKYQKAYVAQILASNTTGDGDVKFGEPGDYYTWIEFQNGTQNILRMAGKIKVT